jgi:unspecific monooxygenase
LLASLFTDQLVLALEAAHETGAAEGQSKLPGRLLAARYSGVLTEQQFRDNVTILFIAGQENPELAVISTLYLLAKNRVGRPEESRSSFPC